MIKFGDIQDAFFFVSSASCGMHTAVLNRDTGQIFYRSEMGDINEISDADFDLHDFIDIPHKNDLDLGQHLVFEFVEAHLPEEYDLVERFFQHRGAYSSFKDLLDTRRLLQKWYEFENQHEEEALRQWCQENEIEISG
jgi:hypothetical protein